MYERYWHIPDVVFRRVSGSKNDNHAVPENKYQIKIVYVFLERKR